MLYIQRKGTPRDLLSKCDVVSYINDEATQHAKEIKTYNTDRRSFIIFSILRFPYLALFSILGSPGGGGGFWEGDCCCSFWADESESASLLSSAAPGPIPSR